MLTKFNPEVFKMFDFCDIIIDIELDSSELLTKFNPEVFKMFDFCDIIIDIEFLN